MLRAAACRGLALARTQGALLLPVPLALRKPCTSRSIAVACTVCVWMECSEDHRCTSCGVQTLASRSLLSSHHLNTPCPMLHAASAASRAAMSTGATTSGATSSAAQGELGVRRNRARLMEYSQWHAVFAYMNPASTLLLPSGLVQGPAVSSSHKA